MRKHTDVLLMLCKSAQSVHWKGTDLVVHRWSCVCRWSCVLSIRSSLWPGIVERLDCVVIGCSFGAVNRAVEMRASVVRRTVGVLGGVASGRSPLRGVGLHQASSAADVGEFPGLSGVGRG